MNGPSHPRTSCNNKVRKVAQLLQELKRASLRPLYIEIALHKQRIWDLGVVRDNSSDPKKSVSTSNDSASISPVADRSWVEILDDAVNLAPYLSDDDHGEVLRLCSVYLLAYLLPYSTGMDYYFAQNLSLDERRLDAFSIDDYIIQMPLEERLELVSKNCPSTDHCGDDEFTVMEQDTGIALGELLDQFEKFLQQRPVHTHQVDLIHLFAMMIHPCQSQSFLSKTIYSVMSERSPAWAKAVRLLENSANSNFQIHYGHRRQVVQMISRCLYIREGQYDYVPLYAGALPHLFTSLHQFYNETSEDLVDKHTALCAIVAVAVQTRHRSSEEEDDFRIIQSTYDWLIKLIMEEHGDCPCAGHCRSTTSTTADYDGCTFYARGEVLSDLIVLSLQSRKVANQKILSYITNSLAELIEWQVDYWNVKLDELYAAETNNVDHETRTYSPCLLSSLLYAARHVFYFLATDSSKKQIADYLNDDDPYGLLIRCSIVMLRHHERCIVTAAKDLLLGAFAVIQGKQVNQIASHIRQSITKSNTQRKKFGKVMQPLVAYVSGKSYREAEFLFNFITPSWQKNLEVSSGNPETDSVTNFTSEEASAWLLMVAMNCPAILSKNFGQLFSLIASNSLSSDNTCLVAKSMLYSRLTHFFINKNDTVVSSVVETLLSSTSNDSWVKYKMGRHALVSGHFRLAQTIFKMLLDKCECMDTAHYVWISALERISDAEAVFSTVADPNSCKGSSMGIPDTSTKLHSAVSYIELLRTTCTTWGDSGLFQLRFLLLRLDFIDLVTVLRHLTRERRFTGKSPNKATRSYWHLQNVVKGFETLAFRYYELYRQFGMFFRDNQSSTALALLQSLSSFMALVTRVCYSDVFAPNKATEMKVEYFKVNDNINHPMASLMRRLYELVVGPMIGVTSIDNRIRAAATLELLDGILLAPLPFPRDFFTTIPLCSPVLLLTADPNPVFNEYDETLTMLESAPTIGFSFYASGRINVDCLKASRVPIWSIVMWFQIKYVGQLILDDEDNNDITETDTNLNDDGSSRIDASINEVTLPDLSAISPAVSKIYSSGHFFFEVKCPPLNVEGHYVLRCKLGCRDANGNDWEIPRCVRNIPIQVSRARTILFDSETEKAAMVTH